MEQGSRSVRAALLLLVLAGCVAPLPASTPTADVMPWGLEGCAFVIAAVQVDEAALAARLPAGFSLAPTQFTGLPAGPRGAVHLDAYDCAGVSWAGRTARPSYGSHYADVIPPSALKEANVSAYFVKWDTLVTDDLLRAQLVDAGAPAHDGDAVVSMTGQQVTATLGFEDRGGFTLTGAIQAASDLGAPLPFTEFTPLTPTCPPASGECPNGTLARWHARLHDATLGTGVGVVTLPPGSWVRELVGADRAPATFIAGTWNLDEADVSFPVTPP